MADGGTTRTGIWTISNVITITRILLVPVFVAVLLCPWPDWLGLSSLGSDWKRVIAAIVFVIISGTDWLDGYLARRLGQVTDFGKFMDPLADKILVAAALIALVELGALPTWVVLVILAREFIVSGVRMMAAAKGVVIAASWLGKTKTVFQMIAIVLFTLKESHINTPFAEAMSDPVWVFSWVVMIIALILTIASLIDYLVKAKDVIGLGDGPAATERERIEALSRRIVESATEKGLTVATAESLTGGLIGGAITSVPGSSSVFKGGVMSYVNEVKNEVLGVDGEELAAEGAVTETVARGMAEGARRLMGADIAVAVTGIAGPGGEEPGKPVGTVWLAVCSPAGTRALRFVFEGDRESVRMQTVEAALKELSDEIGEA